MISKRRDGGSESPSAASHSSREQTAGSKRILHLLGVGIVLCLVVPAIWFFGHRAADLDELLTQAQRNLAAREYASALTFAERVLESDSENPTALLIAGEASTMLDRWDGAIEYYSRIGRNHPPDYARAQFAIAELQFHQGRFSSCESRLKTLSENPEVGVLVQYRLAELLRIVGRRWEAIPYELALIRNGRGSSQMLIYLGDQERAVENREFLQQNSSPDPDDPLRLLALAVIALAEERHDEAEPLLRKAIDRAPELLEAHARLGELLAEWGTDGEFLAWHQQLPETANEHPGIWASQGSWCLRRQDLEPAARCFWESIRLDPNRRSTNFQLGQVLRQLGYEEQAALCLQRSRDIQTFGDVLNALYFNPKELHAMRSAAQQAKELGRFWESWAWSQEALLLDENSPWARENVADLQPRLDIRMGLVAPGYNPAETIDLSHFALPDWNSISLPDKERPVYADSRFAGLLRFHHIATEAGIDFVYQNGADPDTPGARIIETTGGGVAAGDYDRDGMPDLYFTQGGSWPQKNPDSVCDRLFRNSRAVAARDVTQNAALGCTEFGQGAAFGDVNGDGFPDLYVANLGRNVLYLNNGDGTFQRDHSPPFEEAAWTTSCLIADLNRDGHPDLYDVNYCEDDEDFSKICTPREIARACSPKSFRAADDRVLINRGNGEFQALSVAGLSQAAPRYGLGIVACDFTQDGRLELFIANDQVENSLYSISAVQGEAQLRLEDLALERGVAVDGRGRPQGCMGIACGDIDNNGFPDLFVTNFFAEPNVFYAQQPAGFFIDETSQSGLYQPSISRLGFGTQLLDADLDGWLDLVVANGHIDDLRALGQDYRMQPQLFRNLGMGQFVEQQSGPDNDYFQTPRLGRGLARLDWNRDGLEEFAVSHIDDRVSLVNNVTPSHGHFVTLQLAGIQSSRDAVGATAVFDVGETRIVRQLQAGDGYQACNEKRIVIGIGSAEKVDRAQIRWPSGIEQEWAGLNPDTNYLVVEGRPPLPIP